MGQTGKRNIFDELTNKLSNVSIPDTSTGIDFDTFKNNALNKIKGSDLSNLLKSDNLLSSDLNLTDTFNAFSNKIAGTMDVDFKELADSIGVKALPSESVAVIDPAAVPSDEFSLTPDIDWLFIVGVALSCTVIVIGNVTIESTSPFW